MVFLDSSSTVNSIILMTIRCYLEAIANHKCRFTELKSAWKKKCILINLNRILDKKFNIIQFFEVVKMPKLIPRINMKFDLSIILMKFNTD